MAPSTDFDVLVLGSGAAGTDRGVDRRRRAEHASPCSRSTSGRRHQRLLGRDDLDPRESLSAAAPPRQPRSRADLPQGAVQRRPLRRADRGLRRPRPGDDAVPRGEHADRVDVRVRLPRLPSRAARRGFEGRPHARVPAVSVAASSAAGRTASRSRRTSRTRTSPWARRRSDSPCRWRSRPRCASGGSTTTSAGSGCR